MIVHGGGPQIGKTMERMGKKPTFVSGQRVTDEETMDIVEMVLGGKVNKEIVNLINQAGGKAVGLTGKDGGLIQAKKLKMTRKSEETGETEIIDIGLVGEVTEVRPGALQALDQGGFIPVIAPVGVGAHGETYNINADLVAGAVAGALKAEKLILLTDQAGILDKDKNLISTLNKKKVETLVNSGRYSGRHAPQDQVLFRSPRCRLRQGPYHRRPGAPCPAARDLHQRRDRHGDNAVNRFRHTRTLSMGSSYKIRSHPFLCILLIAAALVISDGAGAQSPSAGQTASSISRLVGTVEGGPFSGAVFDDGTGVQSFYPLRGQLPDGSLLLKVRSRNIVVKKNDGALYEIFTTSGATSAVTAIPSPSVTPSEPRESVPDPAKRPLRRRGKAGRDIDPDNEK